MFPNRPLSRTTILAHAVDNRLTAEVRILLRRESRAERVAFWRKKVAALMLQEH
jgi:hypothetical protein